MRVDLSLSNWTYEAFFSATTLSLLWPGIRISLNDKRKQKYCSISPFYGLLFKMSSNIWLFKLMRTSLSSDTGARGTFPLKYFSGGHNIKSSTNI